VKAAGGSISKGSDPVTNLKAVKNETEIAGMRAAHLRDGAALTRYLAWLDREAPSGKISEIDAVAALETFRRDTGAAQGYLLPDDFRRGPKRRHRALPRDGSDQSQAQTVASCFWSTAARNTKTAPPT
jgi:Xaa-Pro aminopeptidase